MEETITTHASEPDRIETFEDAREAYASLVFAFVSRRIQQVEDAQDITAQVFVDGFRHWRRKRGPAKLYLLGIARNKVHDAYRRRTRLRTLREDDLQSDGLEGFVSFAEAQAAHRIAMRLPAAEREAILMQALEEMSVDEIALVLGRSPKATHSLLERARRRIRKMAADSGETL